MAETADQLRAAIEEGRANLDAKLGMLEARARQELSLRTQFSRRPWQALGAAAGAGILLGLVFGGRRKTRKHDGTRIDHRDIGIDDGDDHDEGFVGE